MLACFIHSTTCNVCLGLLPRWNMQLCPCFNHWAIELCWTFSLLFYPICALHQFHRQQNSPRGWCCQFNSSHTALTVILTTGDTVPTFLIALCRRKRRVCKCHIQTSQHYMRLRDYTGTTWYACVQTVQWKPLKQNKMQDSIVLLKSPDENKVQKCSDLCITFLM